MRQVISETDFTRVERKFLYSNFGYLVLGCLIEHITGQPYLSYIKQLFSTINVYQASNRLRPDESHYYSASQDDCYNMPLSRMHSCAGLLVSPQDLVKFLEIYCTDDFEQRGSLDGCESLVVKQGEWCFAICCNRRKSYEHKLPLKDVFDFVVST